MKKFIVSILCISVFFIGLGALAEKAGASFKSDEKALALIKQARLALGGDSAIAEIRSLVIKGGTTVTFRAPDGASRTDQGETEIALQLPDKLMKKVRIGSPDAAASDATFERRLDVVTINKDGEPNIVLEELDGKEGEPARKKIVVRKADGTEDVKIFEGKEGEFTTEDGKKIVVRKVEGDGAETGEHRVTIRKGEGDTAQFKVGGVEKDILIRKAPAEHDGPRDNELLRMTLALLLTAPEGMDVSYTFAGESDVDGTPVNIVDAAFGGSTVKLYLSKLSSLPVMISYTGTRMPRVFQIETDAPKSGDSKKDVFVFTRKAYGLADEPADFQIRFSDYRSVNGVQLPYKWTISVAGQTEEVFDVTSYEVNPANISEKFKEQKVFVRTKKDGR